MIVTRRDLLAMMAAGTLGAAAWPRPLTGGQKVGHKPAKPELHTLVTLSAAQDRLLDEIETAAYLFFWEQADPKTGLVKDRALAEGNDTRNVGSIACTGFGLTGLCIAHRRGYAAAADLEGRVLATLRYLWNTFPNERGWFYHFVDIATGARHRQTELSSIDTALLLGGVITAGEYFQNPEIQRLSQQIYERVDFAWMMNGGPTLSHGWKPESGFLRARWDHYSEHMILDLLAIGSPTHPAPVSVWDAWLRPLFDYYGEQYIGSVAPLFVHQYAHAWFDFRGQRDKYANYFQNSVIATRVHRQFCIDLHDRFADYSADLWGITSSDSAHGYKAWGGPPERGPIDGSLVPAATGGSVVFLPQECLEVLANMREKFGDRAWKRYGFVDAFNPLTRWFDPDVLGIDLGIMMLMAENARSGLIWETFMKSSYARTGMQRAGFRPDAS